MRRVLIPLLLISWGCGTPSLKPVEIEATDMCSFCRMAVSEPRYAAEIVDREENVYKFDDIGCMVRFLKTHQTQGAAMFVRGYRGQLDQRSGGAIRARRIHSKSDGRSHDRPERSVRGGRTGPPVSWRGAELGEPVMDWRTIGAIAGQEL